MRTSRLIKVGFCIIAGFSSQSCKTVSPTTSSTKHIYGRTVIRPEGKLQECQDGRTFPEAIAYLKALGQQIMSQNENTFQYNYAPENFCFEIVDIPGVNASSDPESRKISIRADLLRMGVEGDAPIASIIAHELAHITMQHRRREPHIDDLPSDIDLTELKRRRNAQKAWQTKVQESRIALVKTAVESKFLDSSAKIIRDQTIWDRIFPVFSKVDKASYKNATNEFMALEKEYASALDNPLADPFKTWRLIDMVGLILDDIASTTPEFSKFLEADPRDCTAANLCTEAKALQTISKYVNDVVKPAMDETCAIKLPPNDDPQHYAPWVQWMEQQADEVGFEFYLRAKFLPANYTTFIETMLKADDQFKTCLDNMKIPGWKAPRVTDEFVDGHPPYCFRYDNINIREMLVHENDYADLIPSATVVNIPELKALREAAIKSVTELR